jgi:hypothetical protein
MHEFWFKPRSFGYGATPTTWEGWLVVAAYLLVVAGCVAFTMRDKTFSSWVGGVAGIAIATTVMTAAAWLKTDGQWIWHWGEGH